MGGYKPIYITGNQTGLVQNREEFILPHDAYPVLQNAFVYRERIKRKQGCKRLARLRRKFADTSIGNSSASPWTFNLFSSVSPVIPKSTTQPNAEIEAGSLVISFSGITFNDNGDGTLSSTTPNNSGTINYISGSVTLIHTAGAGHAAIATFNYFPALPCMGIRSQETTSINLENTLYFDTVYAYVYTGSGYQEYIPGTTWTGDDDNFFWSTNYWTSGADKLFWVTNFSGTAGDPIRYTDGSTWTDFTPQITSASDFLTQCLAMLPYRGRLLAFNTYEGASLAASVNYAQRIRWAAIGTPLTSGTGSNANAWRSDIPGQGGYLDIPTSESIISVGFVRDNLVIYCERSTWQLRYTGRSIQPFIVEKINSELGAESTFSAIQFDTSLVGVGDKGIVSCDSYKSERIDIKIPDLVFSFNNDNEGPQRVCGFRNFSQRIAYWMYPYIGDSEIDVTYPNRRLIYNYENDSWAIYIDSFTCLGNYQPLSGTTWLNANTSWEQANFAWNQNTKNALQVAGGNQQGYISILDQQVLNDPTLSITAIGSGTTVLTIPNHNIEDGQIITIENIPAGTTYAYLNDQVYRASTIDENSLTIYAFDLASQSFLPYPVTFAVGTYIGAGKVALRDNFIVQSKKFNYIDAGQNIQLGYIDVLMPATENGAITLNVLLNYNETDPINVLPQNIVPATGFADTFFNSVVPTSSDQNISGTKYLQRVYCSCRGNFLTIVWTLSDAQMAGEECKQDVQIDGQILWVREAGRFTNN